MHVQVHPASYADSSEPHQTAASATASVTTAAGKTTSYEDDDELIDLNFTEYPVSQPYLSLGLTPLSQLSPDITSSGNDLGFFPSMPPPVSPVPSSVFNTGISVDNPFSLGRAGQRESPVGALVMPDAVPTLDSRRASKTRAKQHDNSLSPGYLGRLDPVPEGSGPLDDGSYYHNGQLIHTSSSSSDDMLGDESSKSLIFPSANLLSQSSKQRRRSSSDARRERALDLSNSEWEMGTSLVFHNSRAAQNGHASKEEERDLPVKLSRSEMDDVSPRQMARNLRQQLRDQEILKQKAQLKKKEEEEERKRKTLQEQRAARISKNYGIARVQESADLLGREAKEHGRAVLREAAKYDAQIQFNAERMASSPPTSRQHSRESSVDHQRRPSKDGERDIVMFDQVTAL